MRRITAVKSLCGYSEKIIYRKERIMLEFKTIRQVARTGIISEHYLRLMVERGECPCIKSGNRVLINVPALLEKLDEMSRRVCKDEVQGSGTDNDSE